MTSVLIDNKGLDIFQIISFVGLSTAAVIFGLLGIVWIVEKFIKRDSNGR